MQGEIRSPLLFISTKLSYYLGPCVSLVRRMEARGLLFNVRGVSTYPLLNREGKKLPTPHIYDLSLVFNGQNLKEEFFSQSLKNSEKIGAIKVLVTD